MPRPCCCQPPPPTVNCGFCSGSVGPAAFALTVPRYQYLRMVAPGGAVQTELLVFEAGTYVLDQYAYRSSSDSLYLPGCVWFGPLISIPGSPANTGTSLTCRARWFFQIIPAGEYGGPFNRIGVAGLQTGAISDFYINYIPAWQSAGLATRECRSLHLSLSTLGYGLIGGGWDSNGTYPFPPHCGMTENPIWIRHQILAGAINLVAL